MCKNYNHFLLFTLIALALTCSLAWSFDPLGDPDLIAWWTFNEGKGTLAADSSKNGRDATVNGNAQWIPGIYGNALEFDGTDDYVGIPESLFTDLGQFTIACWLAGDLSGASRTGLVGQNDCIEYGFISSNTIQIEDGRHELFLDRLVDLLRGLVNHREDPGLAFRHRW